MNTPLRDLAGRFRIRSGDSCTIRRRRTIGFDRELLEESDTPGAVVYTGPCIVRPAGGVGVVEVGEGPRALRTFLVRLPWDTTGIEVDMVVTITASSDPHMIDRVLRVTDVQGGANNPDRVLVCEDTLTVTGIEEGS